MPVAEAHRLLVVDLVVDLVPCFVEAALDRQYVNGRPCCMVLGCSLPMVSMASSVLRLRQLQRHFNVPSVCRLTESSALRHEQQRASYSSSLLDLEEVAEAHQAQVVPRSVVDRQERMCVTGKRFFVALVFCQPTE